MGFGSLGMGEIIIIFLVILIFFGAKRLPELAKGMGKGIREFKDAINNVQNEINTDEKKTTPPKLENQKDSPAQEEK
jgi:sec-independent protein translocase protein TatA